MPVSHKGVRIAVIDEGIRRGKDGCLGAAVAFGVAMNGVHDSHGGGLFAEWILGRANLLPGIVEVRKRNGSFENFSVSVGMKQKRAELIAEPKGPVFRFLKGLDIEVRAGQHPATREFVGDGDIPVSQDDLGSITIRFFPGAVVCRGAWLDEGRFGSNRYGISYFRAAGKRGNPRDPVAERVEDVPASTGRGSDSVGHKCGSDDVLRVGPRLWSGLSPRIVDVWSGLAVRDAPNGRSLDDRCSRSDTGVPYAVLQLCICGGGMPGWRNRRRIPPALASRCLCHRAWGRDSSDLVDLCPHISRQ